MAERWPLLPDASFFLSGSQELLVNSRASWRTNLAVSLFDLMNSIIFCLVAMSFLRNHSSLDESLTPLVMQCRKESSA